MTFRSKPILLQVKSELFDKARLFRKIVQWSVVISKVAIEVNLEISSRVTVLSLVFSQRQVFQFFTFI